MLVSLCQHPSLREDCPGSQPQAGWPGIDLPSGAPLAVHEMTDLDSSLLGLRSCVPSLFFYLPSCWAFTFPWYSVLWYSVAQLGDTTWCFVVGSQCVRAISGQWVFTRLFFLLWQMVLLFASLLVVPSLGLALNLCIILPIWLGLAQVGTTI